MPPTMSSHHAHTPQRGTPSSHSNSPAPTVSPSAGAAGLLARQLKQMQQAKDLPGISCGLVGDNVFQWEVMLMISDDCRYYGGMFICLFPVVPARRQARVLPETMRRLCADCSPLHILRKCPLTRARPTQARTSPPAFPSPPPTPSPRPQ
jgi:hypothetical protein